MGGVDLKEFVGVDVDREKMQLQGADASVTFWDRITASVTFWDGITASVTFCNRSEGV